MRASGRAAGTEHHVYDSLNGVLNFAVRGGYIRKNPAATVREDLRGTAEKDYVGKAPTIEQAEAIIAALPEGRYRTYGLVGLWTGMWAGELAGLRVRINFDKLTIQVDETIEDVMGHLRPGTTKTRKSKGRGIPVPSAIMDEIAAFIEGAGLADDDYVFAVPGKLFSHANFYDRQRQPACVEAGLGTRFHTFITLRAREGVPVHLLMAWAGHSNISTTMIYTHVFEDDTNDRGVAERHLQRATAGGPKAGFALGRGEAS